MFLEPEGLDEGEGGGMGGIREGEGGGWGGGVVYPSGVSNCLPEDIQLQFLQKIPVRFYYFSPIFSIFLCLFFCTGP